MVFQQYTYVIKSNHVMAKKSKIGSNSKITDVSKLRGKTKGLIYIKVINLTGSLLKNKSLNSHSKEVRVSVRYLFGHE